ncbi:outer membrane lipoprotein-sorting protein [Pseudomonas syringae]|uniref:Outer membrane lipoprotein-sorting protein n=1 Tax=Pseudomonas syringae TaxID=317 RepID=A0A244EVC9_PSESX|nr:DUF1329 domain-containing protein [Pseudomonas syringae]OUM08412.1 outer membrane lipoprotein-sorting protein [Pseudomonas syringae]
MLVKQWAWLALTPALLFMINTGVANEGASLGSGLTPLGGEMAGNAAGTIPAWSGGIVRPPPDYQGAGTRHIDPYASDKPLFTITHANLSHYRARLTPGQVAMFETYPDSYQMPIYATRRSGSAPQWVYDNARRNVKKARLIAGGNGFADAYGAIPFPIPEKGIQAVWNHIARYRGHYVVRHASEVAVQRDGSFKPVTSRQEVLFRFYDPHGNFATLDNVLFYYLSFTRCPTRMTDSAVLVHETLDQVQEPRQAWAYNAGQRRVRRAPSLAYDMPIPTSEGLRTADDTDMFNGSPDRYDWELLGKREIYIPYNNYRISSPDISYRQLLQVGHLNPVYTRHELHRVWVVEGKLKPSARHVYSRRTLYLDEDSWQAAIVDQYDGRGQLWRVSMAYLKNYYELPTTWSALDVFHDLQARRYHVQNLDNQEPGTRDFSQPVPAASAFKPAALRRRGIR